MMGPLRLKGSMDVSYFTLEVDATFKDTQEVQKFIEWAERLRRFHVPRRDVRND